MDFWHDHNACDPWLTLIINDKAHKEYDWNIYQYLASTEQGTEKVTWPILYFVAH